MKTQYMTGDYAAQEQGFEEAAPEMSAPAGHEPTIVLPVMDEEDARQDEYVHGYREAARIGLAHIQDMLRCLNSFKGNGHFAVRCCMAAHGMWSGLTERDQAEIADYFKCERANVNKLVKLIQKRLGLPPTLGQRSAEGCENMSERRRQQLIP
jgi:hypothetical protein